MPIKPVLPEVAQIVVLFLNTSHHLIRLTSLRDLIKDIRHLWRVSRCDVVMNQFVFLLTGYGPKHSFYINLES